LEYISVKNKLPRHLTFSFACLIRFYKGTWNGENLPVKDSDEIVEAFSNIWELHDYHQIAKASLQNVSFWDEDLTKKDGLTKAIAIALEEIETNGIEKGFANFKKQY
jgi:tagaturonate reductase